MQAWQLAAVGAAGFITAHYLGVALGIAAMVVLATERTSPTESP